MAWIYSIYAIAIATFIFSGTEVSAATWTRVESGRYEVLTDGAAKEAQRAWQVVEQTSLALDRVMGTLPPTAPPVRVILFRSETDFRKFRDNPVTRGFYQGSPERDYLVLPVSVWMKDRVLKHEMAHLYLNHTTGPLPQWLEEGMAEFLSTLEVQPGKAVVGRVIEPHVELLTRADWIPAERLLHVSKGSAEFNQQHQAGLFYAESWALVHMLQHDAAYRGKMAALTTAISEGVGGRGGD